MALLQKTAGDIRVRPGDVVGEVIRAPSRCWRGFEQADEQREAMQALSVNRGEQAAFARAALALKYDGQTGPCRSPSPQVPMPRRLKTRDLWTTFNRVRGKTSSRRTAGPQPLPGAPRRAALL